MKIRRAFSLIILVSVVLAATACSTQQSTASVAATVQTTETSTASEETSMSEQTTATTATTATTEQSIEAKAGAFDMVNKKVRLNSGYDMPIMGLGTYSLDYDTCVNSVKALLGNGGRLIDTAYMYGNEDAVGEGVRRAMEKYVAQEKIRSLGLSNWYVKELTDFLPKVSITPALVQNEIHPYYQEQDVVPFIQEKGIVVQCWYPLGGRGYTAELLNDGTISSIAEAHGVSSAQVILRWDLQRGIVVIPGSSNPDHIKENLDLFSFELSDEEMARINALDRNEKHDWY